MAYADQKMSGNKITALIIVAIIHVLVGYALVTGLAYEAAKKVIQKVTTVDIKEEEKKEEQVMKFNKDAVAGTLRAASTYPMTYTAKKTTTPDGDEYVMTTIIADKEYNQRAAGRSELGTRNGQRCRERRRTGP